MSARTVSPKVLVVDDERSVRDMMESVLAEAGYTVFLAEGADEALLITDSHDIAVTFLDLKLFGMNGIKLCREIRRRKPLTLLYAMTGWSGIFEIDECREAGFDDYFAKPIPMDTLIKAVEDGLEKRRRWTRSSPLL